jgi:hypothetical protein
MAALSVLPLLPSVKPDKAGQHQVWALDAGPNHQPKLLGGVRSMADANSNDTGIAGQTRSIVNAP